MPRPLIMKPAGPSEGFARERLRRAVEWMDARRWREEIGKHEAYSQSLFHHVLTELGFLEGLGDLLRSSETLDLSDEQIDAVFAAVLCHDVGKSDP